MAMNPRVESFMDRASSLIFPGSKTLAGWWRQLLPSQPCALAVGYGFLHRVEAPIIALNEEPVDPLTNIVLQAFALECNGSVRLSELHDRLRLPAAVVQRIVVGMQSDGLLDQATPGQWQLTETARHALEHGSVPVRGPRRRVFPFLERMDAVGQRVAPPAYVPIAECVTSPWTVNGSHQFDIAELRDCIDKPAAWKQAGAFPLDVDAMPDAGALEAWQRVVVDRPERVMLVLLQVNTATGREVHGYAVKVEGWTLHDRAPVLRLPAPAEAIWPAEPPTPVWQEAWRSWCKQRQLPANEIDACSVAYHPPRFEVQAPARLVQRLQAAKSDLSKGETWILVGDGYVRHAVQLQVVGSR
jgi:hypothetical protein